MATGSKRACAKLVVILMGNLLWCPPAVRGYQLKRPVTVADIITMTKLGNPDEDPAQFSPDGKKFVVVLKKGNLEENTNEYSLLLWHTGQLYSDTKPELLVSFSSSSNRPAIRAVRWLADGATLFFLGEHPGEHQELYSFAVSTHALRRITNSPTNVISYSTDDRGDTILYAAEKIETKLFDERARRDGLVLSSQIIGDLLLGHTNASVAMFNGEVQFFLQGITGNPKKLPGSLRSSARQDPPVVSPDGHYAVIIGVVGSIPESWKDYVDPQIVWWTKGADTPLPTGQRVLLLQTLLLDTVDGKIRPLLDAPTSTSSRSEVAWSPDSRSVVITNTYLPVGSASETDRDIRKRTAFSAVEVMVPRLEIHEISQESLNSPTWLAANLLSFYPGRSKWERPGSAVRFRKSEGQWVKLGEKAIDLRRPSIMQAEGLNNPPKIVAVGPKPGQRAVLLDLNPHFDQLQFAHEEAIKWLGADGREARGGLYYPVGYVPGRRYPLVVQTHGFLADRFWIDGPYTTAFAAQVFAAHGIMVLQTAEDYRDSDTPKEVDRAMARLEGAVDHLDQEGLIDPDRVGLLGFSRTCLYIEFALTHSKHHFAAASVTDGVDNGYLQYILGNGLHAFDEALEGSNGGMPFGDGLASWMKRSPGFNADKVSAPLLIVVPNPMGALFDWETFAALRRLGKPVEMVVLQDGEHELQKPWDRRVSLQENVDWFCFWLNGVVHDEQATGEQVARWRQLRSRLNEQRNSDRPHSP